MEKKGIDIIKQCQSVSSENRNLRTEIDYLENTIEKLRINMELDSKEQDRLRQEFEYSQFKKKAKRLSLLDQLSFINSYPSLSSE